MGHDGSAGASTRLLALLSLLALLGCGYHSVVPTAAAPGPAMVASDMRAAPEWMSADTAAMLDLGFDVLVPGWVPAPFSGEPRVGASGGYYSLYWMLPGTPPTFLEITGTVGGAIPDFSWYDRNNQLVQNADVQGYPAYHDVTPAYDLVYWQVRDVGYSVSSQNLAETDSISLANALQVLTPPEDAGDGDVPSDNDEGRDGGAVDDGSGDGEGNSGDGDEAPVDVLPPSLAVPETVASGEIASVGVEGVSGALLEADAGVFVETGDGTYAGVGGFAIAWQAPETTADVTVTFVVIDPDSGEWLASASTLVLGAPVEPPPVSASLDCPAVATGGDLAIVTLYGSGSLVMDVTHGSWSSQSPNTLFDPEADGGGTLVGSLPQDGTASLAWQVPDVAAPVTAYVYATDMNGDTVECAIDVQPAVDLPDPAPVGDAPVEDGTGDQVETMTPSEEEIEPPSVELPLAAGAPSSATESDNSVAGADSASADQSSKGATGGSSAGQAEQVATETLPPAEPSNGTGKTESPSRPTDEPSGGGTDAPAGVSNAVQDGPALGVPPAPTTAPLPSVPTSVVQQPTPTVVGEVAATMGPEGGTLISPAGATLTVPPGVFTVPVTIRIRPVPDSWLPVSENVDLVPGTAFDVTVSGAAGAPVPQLTGPAELSLRLSTDVQPSETAIYRVDQERLQRLDGSLLRRDTVAAPLDHFSRFVAGAPVDDGRTLLPWLIAVPGLLALLTVAGVASNGWRRRPRSTARRISSQRRGVR